MPDRAHRCLYGREEEKDRRSCPLAALRDHAVIMSSNKQIKHTYYLYAKKVQFSAVRIILVVPLN